MHDKCRLHICAVPCCVEPLEVKTMKKIKNLTKFEDNIPVKIVSFFRRSKKGVEKIGHLKKIY